MIKYLCFPFSQTILFALFLMCMDDFRVAMTLFSAWIFFLSFLVDFTKLFFIIQIHFCRNCFHFSRRTQDDERIQKRFILPLLLKPMHNGWHKIILHEWLMDMKNKTILTRQNNAGLLIRLHIEFKQSQQNFKLFLAPFYR